MERGAGIKGEDAVRRGLFTSKTHWRPWFHHLGSDVWLHSISTVTILLTRSDLIGRNKQRWVLVLTNSHVGCFGPKLKLAFVTASFLPDLNLPFWPVQLNYHMQVQLTNASSLTAMPTQPLFSLKPYFHWFCTEFPLIPSCVVRYKKIEINILDLIQA